VGTHASQKAKEAITGSSIATEAFQVLPEGELAVKRDSKVSWNLDVGDGGTVDGDSSLQLDSMLFRWNVVHVVLAVLSLSLHADRYSAILCISKERTSSTLLQHLWENRMARSSA